MAKERVVNTDVTGRFGPGSWLMITLIALVLLPLGQAWGDTVIDPFDTDQTIQSSSPTGGWTGWNSVAGGDILGGNRDMRLDQTAGTGGSLFRVRASGGTFSHNQEVTVAGRSETRWDGMTAFDLTEAGAVHTLVLTGVSTDLDITILFTVNGTSTHTLILNAADSPWAEITIPFSSFSDPTAFQSVDSIDMRIPHAGSSVETEVAINEIGTQASPEPPPPPAAVPTLSEWGMILFSLFMGTCGVIFMRRRKFRA